MFSPVALQSVAIEPSWADLDPATNRHLIVDLRQGIPRKLDQSALSQWLKRQVVPVVGVGPAVESELSAAVDLVVTVGRELDRAVRCIREHPVATSVLVQVLRSVDHLPVDEALALESMAYATLQGGREFATWLANHRAAHPARARRAADPLLLRREHGRLHLVLNDPETRNALSVQMRDALTEAFKLVALDDTITDARVSANGPCFSSGGDLDEFGTTTDIAEAHRIRMMRMPARYLAAHAERYSFRVHRACIGAGIELPAFARRLSASANTFFQLPEVSMGLIPGAGGCVSIPRRIGRQRTAYMAILGKRIPAERALAWGLIDAIED